MSMICSKSVALCLGHIRRTPALNNSLFTSSIHNYNHITNKSYHLASCNQAKHSSATNQSAVTRIPRRNIFAPSSLGIDKLDALTERRKEHFQTGKERYIERLAGYLEAGDTKSIITDDLINLIALAETDEHLDLIEKFAAQATADPEESSWGSAVMRIYYKMDKLDRAITNLRDERFGRFFQQRTSYQIAITMLYNAGRYEEAIDLYNLAVEKLDLPVGTDRNLSIIAFASYAKINTPDSYQKALQLYNTDSQNPRFEMRVLTIMSYLAVHQGDYKKALNLIADSPSKNHIANRELKTMALLKLERYEDILFHLRTVLADIKRGFKLTLKETVELLEQSKDNITDEKLRDELIETLNDVKHNQLVGEETLESIVFKPIARDPNRIPDRSFDRGYNRGFDRDSSRGFDRGFDRNSSRGFDRNSNRERGFDRGFGRGSDRRSDRDFDRDSDDRDFDRKPYQRRNSEYQQRNRAPRSFMESE